MGESSLPAAGNVVSLVAGFIVVSMLVALVAWGSTRLIGEPSDCVQWSEPDSTGSTFCLRSR